ncbi:hypothetical protein AB0L64_26165 [Kribbella sp. NPDC051936]|uniref:hypothetical protein n=1 Tax=Kribbella sp. NPDC051936 TaxID=3154946 RepID=UPI00341DA253
MAEGNHLVLVAAYQDDHLAQQEFDALAGLAKAKAISTDGMILVAKDADGAVRLSDTGDQAEEWPGRHVGGCSGRRFGRGDRKPQPRKEDDRGGRRRSRLSQTEI